MRVQRFDGELRVLEEHASPAEFYDPDSNQIGELYDGCETTTTLDAVSSLEQKLRSLENIIRFTVRLELPETLTLAMPWTIPHQDERIRGDYWDRANNEFVCQSAGYYNIKAACDIHARIYESGPPTYIGMGIMLNGILIEPLLDKHYIDNPSYTLGISTVKCFLSGADKVPLMCGDRVRHVLISDATTAINTGYLLHARFAAQRTGNFSQTPDVPCPCSGI